MKRKGLFALLLTFATSLVTATAFGYWSFSGSGEQEITPGTSHTQVAANQYTDDRAVCYVSTNSSVKYTTIEKALSVATSGSTVYVIPGLKDNSGNSYQIHITNNVIIPSGVTLTLPYTGETYFDANTHGATVLADSNAANVKTYRQTQVVLDQGVTMTLASGSKLNIGGVQGGPGQGLAGQTSGEYCEITMSANSKIISNGGNIDCFGYIKEYQSQDNGSQIIMNSGILLTPFTIYDYKAGGCTVPIANIKNVDDKFMPFVIFDMCNIQVDTRIFSTASWKTRAMVYIATNTTYYPTDEASKLIFVIGNTSTNTALVLSSGYIDVKYHPANFGYSSTNFTDNTHTTFEIHGTVSLGSFKMEISVLLKKYTINTDEMFFPVSYRFNFIVNNGGKFAINKKAKFMGESLMKVEAGGLLEISNKVIFYQTFKDTLQTTFPYPASKIKAHFICDGKTTVASTGALSGIIETTQNTGELNYNSSILSVTSPECGGNYPSSQDAALSGAACDVITYAETSQAYLTTDGGVTSALSAVAADTKYESVGESFQVKAVQDEKVPLESVEITMDETSQQQTGAATYKFLIAFSPADATVADDGISWSIGSTTGSAFNGKTLNIEPDRIRANITSADNEGEATINVSVTDYFGNNKNASITVTNTKSCVAEGTLITMADGTQKPVEDVNKGEMVMTWNFFTGTYEPKPVIAKEAGVSTHTVISIELSNRESISVIAYQSFFDIDAREYFQINTGNYMEAIGRNIAITNDGELTSATITNITVETKTIGAYEIITANNFNFIANGVLTCEPYIFCMNIFTVNENFMYDPEEVAHDIETYGLYTYDEWSEYMTEEEFYAFNGPYFKIAVGKGITTKQHILDAIQIYNNDYSHEE